MDFIPVINIRWDVNDKGNVYLIKEKTKNTWIKKIIEWVGKSQDFHIHLDKVGTTVWRSIDGKRTVNDIALLLKETYGDEFKQPEHRVAYFLGLMKKDKFVDLLYKV